MELVARILKNPSCECLITFMYEAINLRKHTPEFEPHLDQLYGTTAWRLYIDDPDSRSREEMLVELYRHQLENQARMRYVRWFRMVNERNRTEYYLIFGTNHHLGLSRMKEAMWKADPQEGTTFRDKDDPEQQFLFDLGDVSDLRRRILKRLSESGPQDIAAISDFVLFDTNYSERMHLRQMTLEPMEKEGLITVARPPNKRNRLGEYPPGTKVSILGVEIVEPPEEVARRTIVSHSSLTRVNRSRASQGVPRRI